MTRLTFIENAGRNKHKNILALFACTCGKQTVIQKSLGTSGKQKSCGCIRVDRFKTHGESATSMSMTWRSMIARCHRPAHESYKYYGGRGIFVCERWRTSFVNFRDDMGPKPGPSYTVDRIDNDKGYEPGNCRWATKKEQAANRRKPARAQKPEASK